MSKYQTKNNEIMSINSKFAISEEFTMNNGSVYENTQAKAQVIGSCIPLVCHPVLTDRTNNLDKENIVDCLLQSSLNVSKTFTQFNEIMSIISKPAISEEFTTNNGSVNENTQAKAQVIGVYLPLVCHPVVTDSGMDLNAELYRLALIINPELWSLHRERQVPVEPNDLILKNRFSILKNNKSRISWEKFDEVFGETHVTVPRKMKLARSEQAHVNRINCQTRIVHRFNRLSESSDTVNNFSKISEPFMRFEHATFISSYSKRQQVVFSRMSDVQRDCYMISELSTKRVVDAQIGFDVNHKFDFGNLVSSEKLSEISTTLTSILPHVSWKSALTATFVMLRMVYKHWNDTESILLSLTGWIATLGLCEKVVEFVKGFVLDCFNHVVDFMKSRVVRAQIAGENVLDVSSLLKYIGGPIACIFTALIMREIPGGNKPDAWLNRFSKISGIIKSTADVNRVGNDMFSEIVETIRVNVFGMDKRTMNAWEGVDEWFTEATSLVPNFEMRLRDDPTIKQKIDVLYERGLNISRTLDSLKVPSTQRDHITKTMMFLSCARDKAANISAGQISQRVPPTITHFFGNSGVGKSSILACLTADIQAALGVQDPKDIPLLTYYRQPGEKFWDGFRNATNVVVCDDFGSVRDSTANPSEEFLEAIRMSNTANYLLNMADLKDKGTTFFSAKSVIWTSNRSVFECESLTNFEAVIRRITRRYRQKPHPEFAKTVTQKGKSVQILDTRKIRSKFGNTEIEAITSCILFDEVVPENDNLIHADLTYEQMKDTVIADLLNNLSYHEEFNEKVVSYAERAIQRANATRNGETEISIERTVEEEMPLVDFGTLNVKKAQLFGFNPIKRNTCLSLHDVDMAKARIIEWNELEVNDDHCDLRRAKCVEIGEGASEFVEAYVNAYATASLYGVTQLQKDTVFSTVFEALYPYEYTLCLDENCNGATRIESEIERRCNMSSWKNALYQVRDSVMSMGTFEVLVSFAAVCVTGLLSFAAYKIFSKISKWWFGRRSGTYESQPRKMSALAEGVYDTSKTTARTNARVESLYDSTKTPGPTVKLTESLYDSTKTVTLPRKITESIYDSSKTEARPMRTTEIYADRPGRKNEIDPEFAQIVAAQAVNDKNAQEIVAKLYRSMYVLEFFQDGEWRHAMNIMIIKGRLAIVNKHILCKKSISQWRMRNAMKPDGYEFNLFACNAAILPEESIHGQKDLMMVELPRIFEQHPDMTKKFMTSGDFSRFQTLKTISLIGHGPTTGLTLRQYFSDTIKAHDSVISFDTGSFVVHCRQYFAYGIQTVGGDCGGALVAYDKNFNNKIIGIHAGGEEGTKYTGFGVPVSQEVLTMLEKQIHCKPCSKIYPAEIAEFEVPTQPILNAENDYNWKINLPFVGNFMYLGKLVVGAFGSAVSQINRSPVHGIICEPTMKPAHLAPFRDSNDKFIDPMAKARIKASPAPFMMDEELLNASVLSFTQKINVDVNPMDRRVLTYEEAILGIDGQEVYASINRSTSPGYGWVKRGKGKTEWLGEFEFDTTNEELRSEYSALVELCKTNRPTVIWSDTLKDEKRPIGKVDAGKTRLFSVGEMAYTIAFRQYFLGFIAHMMRHKIDFESCVGINAYSRDWTKLAYAVTQVGDKVIAGDFGNYDGTLNAELLWRVLDVVESFYKGTEEEKAVRRSLWSEIVNSIHLNGQNLYSWTHSQPSGCPMTTILNCCYHSISARYVYLVCAQKYMPSMLSLSNFDKYVRHFNYGDDDLWNLSDVIIGWFNQLTITEAYATFGMEYTDEAKTGNIVAYRKLDEVNFLKRVFRWDDEQMRYRAPLALDVIREMAMWNRKTVDPYILTADVLQEAVHELAQWDESTFNRELPSLERAREILAEFTPCAFETYRQYQEVEYARYVEN